MMVEIPEFDAYVFVVALAIVFLLAGMLLQEVIAGWRRATRDLDREALLRLAERRRPGRLT